MNKKFYISLICCCLALIVFAQASQGYYDAANGKKDAALKTALFNIIKTHNKLGYYATAGFFEQADRTADGYIWDMYSNKKCMQWSGCGLNREHNLPKSWFGISGGDEEKEPIGCDYHNLYPSDASANSAKGNLPLGEVNNSPTYNNGVVKTGTSSFTGYSGKVFEPADEYKGDFARDYMYMVTCYEDYANRWTSTGTSSMLRNNTYPVFNDYAINLLMKWHRNDTVSKKEIDRNNAVYKVQGNRNPFVDNPVLAEYIWGNYKGVEWNGKNTERKDFYISYDTTVKVLFASLNNPDTAEYLVFNSAGIKVFEGKFTSDTTIDVKHFPRGLYVILIYTESQRKAEKFWVDK